MALVELRLLAECRIHGEIFRLSIIEPGGNSFKLRIVERERSFSPVYHSRKR